MCLLRERYRLEETVDPYDRIQCVLRRGTCEQLLEHTDALTEDVVYTRGDLVEGAMTLRLLEPREQILLCADHVREGFVFCCELARDVIQLRHTGGGQLPAVQIARELHALHEPHVAGGKAEENCVRTQLLFRHGGRIKRQQIPPEHRRIPILPPAEPFHEMQHGDVDEHGTVVRTGKEQPIGHEIQPRADGGSGYGTAALPLCTHGEEQEPRRQHPEDEQCTHREQPVQRRQGEHARADEQQRGDDSALTGGEPNYDCCDAHAPTLW